MRRLNKNYNRGRAFEYRVKKYLEDRGWTVFRTAGSHSKADLVCIKNSVVEPYYNQAHLVQCKYSKSGCFYISKKELRELQTLIDELCQHVYVAFNDENGHIHLRYAGDLDEE